MRWRCLLILLILTIVESVSVVAHQPVDIPGFELSSQNVTDEHEVWDFSDRETINKMSLQYFGHGDSVVMEMLPMVRCDYAIDGDSLRLMAAEGVSWRCQIDSLQQSGNLMKLNGTLSSNLSRKFDVTGWLLQKSSSDNTVVLEPGDTIRNVLLVEQSFEGKAIELCLNDSAVHTLTAQRKDWFAENSQYPIAIELKCYFSGNLAGDYAYIFPLNKQEQKKDQQDRILQNRLFESNPTQSDKNNAQSGTIPFESDKLVVSTDNGRIDVGLPSGIDSADVILCDIQGRVLEAHKGVLFQTSFSNLRPGEYLVNISSADWRITKKISTH